MGSFLVLAVKSLTDLHDSSKGFLVDDTLIVEAEVCSIFTVTNYLD